MSNCKSMLARCGRQNQRYSGATRLIAGTIPVVGDQVLLVRSGQRQDWMFPKGGWENDETVEEAASREAWEEAGVRGEIKGALGTYEFESRRGEKCKLFMYVLEARLEAEYPEQHRERRLFTVEEALVVIQRPEVRAALEAALPLIRQGSPADRAPVV